MSTVRYVDLTNDERDQFRNSYNEVAQVDKLLVSLLMEAAKRSSEELNKFWNVVYDKAGADRDKEDVSIQWPTSKLKITVREDI